jgi:hypothetical protein
MFSGLFSLLINVSKLNLEKSSLSIKSSLLLSLVRIGVSAPIVNFSLRYSAI